GCEKAARLRVRLHSPWRTAAAARLRSCWRLPQIAPACSRRWLNESKPEIDLTTLCSVQSLTMWLGSYPNTTPISCAYTPQPSCAPCGRYKPNEDPDACTPWRQN